jgi:putative addiction module killer protein
MRIVEYLDGRGRSPFGSWFSNINAHAAAKVATALVRLEGGNTPHVKSVGRGVHEIRIEFGPGYRVYFGFSGSEIVILLAGGTKKRQDRDIATAQKRWADCKARAKKET